MQEQMQGCDNANHHRLLLAQSSLSVPSLHGFPNQNQNQIQNASLCSTAYPSHPPPARGGRQCET